jgi:hypothetical protein
LSFVDALSLAVVAHIKLSERITTPFGKKKLFSAFLRSHQIMA